MKQKIKTKPKMTTYQAIGKYRLILSDSPDPKRRLWAAKKLAPFTDCPTTMGILDRAASIDPNATVRVGITMLLRKLVSEDPHKHSDVIAEKDAGNTQGTKGYREKTEEYKSPD